MAELTSIRFNEIVGFLHMWNPGVLQQLSTDFPDEAATGMFKPGILAGHESVKILLLASRSEPLYRMLAFVIEKAEHFEIRLKRRLRISGRLNVICQIATASGTSGTLGALYQNRTNWAWVGSAVAFASTIVNLISLSLLRGRGGRDYEAALTEVGKQMITAILLRDQIGTLLPQIGEPGVHEHLAKLCADANKMAEHLNKAMLPFSAIL